jgi:CheY-like chemotaxis protein
MASILIIDDNDEFRYMLRTLLERAGHQTTEAHNGMEGMRVYRQFPTDVVCCDLFMPEKEGLETLRELRREFPTVKLIAMSGGGLDGAVDMLPVARYFGANEALQKPFELEVLLGIIARLHAVVG